MSPRVYNSMGSDDDRAVARDPVARCSPPGMLCQVGACPLCEGAPGPRRRGSRALERALLVRSFGDFVALFWPVVTGTAFEPNGATTAIVAALQDVADGRVTRLAIAVPPGCGKTTLLALYAAWRLARDAGWRSIHAAHAFDLAATESRRVRRLIESPEFQARFPVALRADESTVAHWATTADGRYFAVGTDGALTGRRAHESVCDDPLNATDRFSKAARDGLWAWFVESLSTRLDGDRAPMIVVQQRLDRDDLIGRLIAAGGWTVLELAAEDDQGNLLAPNVLPREKLAELRTQIGAATYSCQYLQKPASDEDATIKRAWWKFHRPAHVAENSPRPLGCDLETPAVRTPDTFDRIVIACDLTFGSTKGDFVAIQAWGGHQAGRYLLQQFRKRCGLLESVGAIKAMARDYPGAKIIVEKAANGAGAIEELAAAGVPGVVAVVPLGSKAQRLGLVSATIEGGSCFLPLGASWLHDFTEELAGATAHDDAQDAAAMAIHELNSGAVDPALAERRRIFVRGIGALLADKYADPVERARRAAHATAKFDARACGAPEPSWAEFVASSRPAPAVDAPPPADAAPARKSFWRKPKPETPRGEIQPLPPWYRGPRLM